DAELKDTPADDSADPEAQEAAAVTAAGDDSPAFRIRRDMDGSRHADAASDFPAEEMTQPVEDSAPELFPDEDQPAASTNDTARIDKGFIPDTADPQPAQLRPASGSQARTSGVQAPLALPDNNPSALPDYRIRSDITKIT